jgi:rubrerythrin
MGALFQVSELVDMAISEEHHGTIFYEALERQAQSPLVRKAAGRLAEEERGHERAFTTMKENVASYLPPESYPGEYEDYVKALLDGRTFPDEQEAIALAHTGADADALRIALRFEKNSLLFFSEMRVLVPESERALVDELIEEERRHLVDLNRLLVQVDAQ